MKTDEAVKIIKSIINSIKESPDQFKIHVSVTGQSIVSHGGTGLQITATGGGPNSTTIGQQVSVKSGDVEISNQKAAKALDEQFTALVNSLESICQEIQKDNPDTNIVTSIYQSLKNTWVPGIIISVLGNVLSMALGI